MACLKDIYKIMKKLFEEGRLCTTQQRIKISNRAGLLL